MGLFIQDNDYIGIDIGSTSVRLVQVKKSISGKPVLVSFSSAAIPPNIALSDSKLDMQKVAQVIQKLVKSSRISTKNVVAAILGSSVFSTVVKMPPMSQSELAQAVKYQAEQNVPLKIEDVKIDWQVVRENPQTKELAVMIVAAPKSKIERTIELFEMADLDVIYLETTPIATARAIQNPNDPLVMVLDMGGSSTELSIVENGVVSHVRSLPTGGIALTRAIAQNLGLDYAQAEQFKRKFGLSQDKLEGQVFRAMRPILNNITEEIQRSVKFYNDQFGSQVQKIVLTGGSARLPELISYIKANTNMEVVYGNSWVNVSYQADIQEKLNQNSFEFSCAVGLAMREQ